MMSSSKKLHNNTLPPPRYLVARSVFRFLFKDRRCREEDLFTKPLPTSDSLSLSLEVPDHSESPKRGRKSSSALPNTATSPHSRRNSSAPMHFSPEDDVPGKKRPARDFARGSGKSPGELLDALDDVVVPESDAIGAFTVFPVADFAQILKTAAATIENLANAHHFGGFVLPSHGRGISRLTSGIFGAVLQHLGTNDRGETVTVSQFLLCGPCIAMLSWELWSSWSRTDSVGRGGSDRGLCLWSSWGYGPCLWRGSSDAMGLVVVDYVGCSESCCHHESRRDWSDGVVVTHPHLPRGLGWLLGLANFFVLL